MKEDTVYLKHIHDAILTIETFTDGKLTPPASPAYLKAKLGLDIENVIVV